MTNIKNVEIDEAIKEKFEFELKAGFVVHKESDQVLFVEEGNYLEKNLRFFDSFLNREGELFVAQEENDFFTLIGVKDEDGWNNIPLPVFLDAMGIEYDMIDQHFVGHHFVWSDDGSWDDPSSINYIPFTSIRGKREYYEMIEAEKNASVMEKIDYLRNGGVLKKETWGRGGIYKHISAIEEEGSLRFIFFEHFKSYGPRAERKREVSIEELLDLLDDFQYKI